MAKLTEKMLAQYYDGALTPPKAKLVEEQLEKSPEAREAFGRMNRLGELLTLMNEEALNDVSFEGFNERIEAQIRKENKSPIWEGIKVYLGEFFENRRIVWVPAMAVAACALAVVIARPLLNDTSSKPVAAGGEIRFTGYEANETAPSSTIVSMSSSDNNGWTYSVSDGKGGTVGVVWIVENFKGE